MLTLLKWFFSWRIIVVLILFFCVVQPFLMGTYNQVRAFYWWMRP
jgi:hypothetical protein